MPTIDHPAAAASGSKAAHRPVPTSRIARVLLCTALVASAAALFGASPAQAAPAAPVIRDVLTGGDSIAVLWNPAAGTSPKSYTVYRDNRAVATVNPPPAPTSDNPRITTTARYIDTNVVRGTTYLYKVTMTTTDNTVSGFSDTKSATHPLAADTTAVPNVLVDTTTSDWKPSWATPLNDGAALIRTWYPKFADKIVKGAFPVPSTITLVNSAGDGGGARADFQTQRIFVGNTGLDGAVENAADPAWIASFQAIFIHEMTHLLQGYPAGPPWLAEGIAVWATHQYFNDAEILAPAFSEAQYYTAGYEPTARFLQWLIAGSGVPWTSTTHTRENLVREANVQANAGMFDNTFFVTRTGLKAAALWGRMAGYPTPVEQKFHPARDATQCIDNSFNRLWDNHPLSIGTCWNSGAQVVAAFPTATGSNIYRLVIQGMCMDTWAGPGASDGNSAVLYTCTAGATWQYWTIESNGTIRNNYSGRCVQQPGAASGALDGLDPPDPTPLTVRTCASPPGTQQWTRQLL